MFWQNYVALCNSVGKSPSAVAIEIGLTNASASGWKRGAVPRAGVLAKLAEYFGVPLSALTEDTARKEPALTPDEQTLLGFFRGFSREGKGRLLDYAESMKRSGMYEEGTDYFLKGFIEEDREAHRWG